MHQSNPHHILTELDKDEVGELQIRGGVQQTQVATVPADLTLDEIREHLWEIGAKPGDYRVYGLHYATKRQLKGFHTFNLRAQGVPQELSPAGFSSALLEQQFVLLREMREEIAESRRLLAQERAELDRRQATIVERQHEAELDIERQRHSQGLDFQERLFALQQGLEQRYAERQAALDQDRTALEIERQRLIQEVARDRIQVQADAHEREFEALRKAQKRRFEELEEQAQRTNAHTDPLALLKLFPQDLLADVVRAQLPKPPESDDGDGLGTLDKIASQIEPLARLIGGLRFGQPAGATHPPPISTTPAPPGSFRG